jgi:hypothetical protein
MHHATETSARRAGVLPMALRDSNGHLIAPYSVIVGQLVAARFAYSQVDLV